MSGFVYFIGDPQSSWVKIGSSKDVAHRLRELLCASHENLAVLCAIPGTAKDERRLHRVLRGPRRREWFVRDAAVEYVLELAKAQRSVEEIVGEIEQIYSLEAVREHVVRVRRLEALSVDPSLSDDLREVYAKRHQQVQALAAGVVA